MRKTLELIERVERLEMTGEIGDGTVAQLHELAALARLELVERPFPALCPHAWHSFPAPNSWGASCPSCGMPGPAGENRLTEFAPPPAAHPVLTTAVVAGRFVPWPGEGEAPDRTLGCSPTFAQYQREFDERDGR